MFTNDAQLAECLPDHINPSTVTRSFLLSLLFHVKKEKYVSLYNSYKNRMKQSSTKGGKLYNTPLRNPILLIFKISQNKLILHFC